VWKCPRCGAKLVHRNLSHACGEFTVEGFLARGGAGKKERDLFERFVACIAACGPYEAAPAKTRVAFMVKVRFASVNRVGDGFLDVHLVVPREIASTRFRRVERVGAVWVHHLRIERRADLDRELRGWIREAYEQYGERRYLAR
jgi:hypothetical protein